MIAGGNIYNGDCLDVMKTLDADSIDCVVTDPPYGLSFMGKEWDHGIPGKEFWEIALNVMKPGAFLLAFGGTRTFHRLTCAIEDAGFEIRDCMMWLYGSGFPKSHDVSKAIDKAAGAERIVIGENSAGKGSAMHKMKGDVLYGGRFNVTAPSTDAARQWSGWGTALKPAWEPIIVARKPLEGTVAENVLKWGCGAMNIDEGRIGVDGNDPNHRRATGNNGGADSIFGVGNSSRPATLNQGRWPANVILDEEAGAMLDGQSGTLKSGALNAGHKQGGGMFMDNDGKTILRNYGNDSGGASRFFYCAKSSKRERGEGNNHPTVKPISLLRYLIKLVCPPNGIVLDPFLGSGSTAVAAQALGFKFIGIEKEEQYCEIAEKRISQEIFNLKVAV